MSLHNTNFGKILTPISQPVDANQPLPQVLALVKEELILLAASNFLDWRAIQRDQRRAEDRKNPALVSRFL
jgi:hypothetical protein